MFNIILIGTDQRIADLGGYLEREGHQCLCLQDCGQFVPLAKQVMPDLIIMLASEPSESLLTDLQACTRGTRLPVVLFVEKCSDGDYQRVAEAQIASFIVNGLNDQRLPSIMQTAIARFRYFQSLTTALEEARTQLEDRKRIDHAKAILIKARNFSEDEAYHTLRKLAMDRNITIGEMAKNVIAMADLLK